jgi:FKBP-type peptidyl-prolyl cis-trans isomerase
MNSLMLAITERLKNRKPETVILLGSLLLLAILTFGNQHKVANVDGLIIEDLIVGKGEEALKGKTLTIHYSGVLATTNAVFDSSLGRGTPYVFTIGLGHAIPAWDIGVIHMKVGGKRKLTVPPKFGYGEKGAGSIVPPNSTLIYEVTLLDVK